MAGTIGKIINLAGNMGWRYMAFRARYEVMRRTGILKRKFPVSPPYKQYITLEAWKSKNAQFFFDSKGSLTIPREPQAELKATIDNIKAGKLLLFNSIHTDLGANYDWVTNPDSGYRYDVHKHWTEIADYSKEAGDIKFVWEKSRFSYLYDIIRYDYHFNDDCGAFVFADIQSWIKANPINQGPNYRCSQEMSLRVMNWLFALHYYSNSPSLTADVFNEMQQVIYWHVHHVYTNIDFSRIAVRNNHAITETLLLYLAGLYFPAMPGADKWKRDGKRWFEEEIAYQIYEDGTFLQFSMNYHRVAVQLLTWGIVLSEKNGERFSDAVYDRAKKSVVFLRTCMVDEHGWLPNYGGNDGALFFKLSSSYYRDYRPQINALGKAIGMDAVMEGAGEDVAWYGLPKIGKKWLPADGTHSFTKGGYYVIREPETLTFIRCGGYKDRPAQADNLHLDIWYKGENILPDAGSYKYNTDEQTMRYFNGTAAHNTVMLDDKDQMLKGTHFIWFYWTQCRETTLTEDPVNYYFSGSINAFTYIKKGIVHKRKVVKRRSVAQWEVIDEVVHVPKGINMRQLWHFPVELASKVSMVSKGTDGEELKGIAGEGWISSLYGKKEKTKECYFSTEKTSITTVIKVDRDS